MRKTDNFKLASPTMGVIGVVPDYSPSWGWL